MIDEFLRYSVFNVEESRKPVIIMENIEFRLCDMAHL